MTRALLVALLLGGDRAGQVGEDLAGAHDQVGDLRLCEGRVVGVDRGDVALGGVGAFLVRGLGCVRGDRRHQGGLVGRGVAEGRARGGGGRGGAGHDLVEGGGGGRGDRAEESLGVLGVGLQGGGDDRLRGAGRVEGDAAVREENRTVRGGGELDGGGRDDDRAARVGQGAQEGFELGARVGGQRDGVFDEEDFSAGDDGAGDQGLEAFPSRQLTGVQVHALGEARHLEGAHEVIPVGDGARGRQGSEDVLADRQRVIEGCIRADQGDRADAAGEACRPRARGCGDDAAGVGLLEAREDEEEGAGAAARRIQDRAERARAEAHVDVSQEDRARGAVRVGQAQAGDQDLAAVALRGEGAARPVPGARLGGGQVRGQRRDDDLALRGLGRLLLRLLLLLLLRRGVARGRGRGPLDGSVDRGGGRFRDGLPGGGRQVGHVLAIRTLQVFTRLVRHTPILSGSCRLCRQGARGWGG